MQAVFPNFDTLGIMIDCSHGAVYTVAALKCFLDIMQKLGYNMLSQVKIFSKKMNFL